MVALIPFAFAASAQASLDWLGVNGAQAIRTHTVTPGVFYDRLTGMGGNVVRDDINWNEVEPYDDAWSWAYPDREINAAPPGVGIILTLQNSPRWARNPVENLLACGTSSTQTCRMPPASTELDEWMEFVRTTVSRYRSMVVAVEVWNEPNLKYFWQPSGNDPARWARLVELASDAVSQVDPAIPVITGGLWSGTDTRLGMMQAAYLDAAYASNPALAQDADGIGIHPYPGDLAPDAAGNGFERTLNDIGSVVQTRDPGKPLWATETGYSTRGSGSVTAEEQRDWLLQIYDKLNAPGTNVKAMIIHSLFEPTWLCRLLLCDQREVSYGIVNPIGNLAKPAWTGFHDRFFP